MSPADDGSGPAIGSWQADPFGRHVQRWWTGSAWSERVRDGDLDGIDPPGVVARPERLGLAHVPAEPIDESVAPVRYVPEHLPRVLLLGVLVLVSIVVLIAITILTA